MREGGAPPDSGAGSGSAWGESPLADVVRSVKASRRDRAAAEARDDGVTVEELMQRAENEIAANVGADEPDVVESHA
jgi:hypothetical protein